MDSLDSKARKHMIDCQLKPDGVTDEAILEAFMTVPRDLFVEDQQQACAYIDEELVLNCGRFLLSPSLLARAMQELNITPEMKVMDIGAATGYSSAVFALLTQHVTSVVEPPALVEWAQSALMSLGIENVTVVNDPLYDGYAANAPYDVIFINGAVEVLADTLFTQLTEGGQLLAVSQMDKVASQVTIWRKKGNKITKRICFDAFCPQIPAFQARSAFSFG